ncbi:hypothetical protein QNI19_24800 [Cytophagaceae bacterium DM2B3-1]|uniref:Alpha/beta hydrolase n=1 Tax=Xanthocytophaga flava TaxID=3048013 RepID=A0ABT7CR12_9BACT|nr:hypothetical protein [Xanthocytophaga flavus]MDJ1496180.1 hypothetical protein [Xanthocytophaga flavus]
MKTKTLLQAIVLFLIVTKLYSQDLAGQWNGSLQIQGKPLRIVFHVTKINNEYKATLDSPDQNAAGLLVTTTSFHYPNVKFEITDLGMVYEGSMSSEGITGKWLQSGTAFFLSLVKNTDILQKAIK